MPAPPVQQRQPTTVAGAASVFQTAPKQGPNSTPNGSNQPPKIHGMTDDLFKQISNACKSLSTVANLLQQNAMTEKASVSLNKSRSIRTTFNEKDESRRVLNTKTVNVTMGVNNDSTAIFMSGAKLPFSQFMGGRNAYATLNVITNDPEVVVDVMSMFHGSTVYEAINNMMQQARGLLKTRAPFNPSSGVFKRYLDRGAQQIFPDESVRALRVLRAQIKADQFINIVSQSVKQLTGKIDDLFFTQEEPLILYHPLMNSLGYKSFYPVKADLKSVEGSPGYISIVLTMQWIDSKLFMSEAIRHRKSSTDSLGYKGMAWFVSFADSDTSAEKDKEKKEARKKRDNRTKSLVQDIINDRESAQNKSSEARRYGKDIRYQLSNMAVSLSAAPPLMAYALARHLEYIESIRALTQERIKQNPVLLLNTTEGALARNNLANELRASGVYTPHLVTAPTSSRDTVDSIGSLGRFGITAGTAVVAGGLDRIPIGHKSLAGLAAKSHAAETAGIVRRIGGRFASPAAGALRGLKAGGLFTLVDILAGATMNGFQLNAYQKAATSALSLDFLTLKTTDSKAIDFNTIPVFDNHIEQIIRDTVKRSNGEKGFPLLFNLNIPFLMASYYIDFIVRILEIYDKPDTIEAHIKAWTTKALRAFENRLTIPENKPEVDYFGYTVKGLSNGSTNGGFYGYNSSTSLNNDKDSLPDYCFLITTGVDGSPEAMNEEPTVGGRTFSQAKKSVQDLDDQFKEAYKKFTSRGHEEDSPRELAKIFMDRLGATSMNIIRGIRDLNIRTIELYLKQMDGFNCSGYAYSCFSLISLNRLYGLCDILPDLETSVNPNTILRKLRNFNELGPEENTTDLQNYNFILQTYANTLKKYRDDLRKKVGRRLTALPKETKDKLIKRARTLVAYGNNYRKYDSVEREVNTAMFEFMRAYTIDFLLGAKRYYETDMAAPTKIEKSGSLSKIESTDFNHLDENPYYVYFIQPYTFGQGYSWTTALTEAIKQRGGLGALALEAVATTVLTVVIGAIFGLEAVAAGIIAAIIYLVITSAESVLNWSYNFISNSLTTVDTDSEKVASLLKNAPLAFLGQGIIYRLIEQLPEDSLLFHSNVIYPPEVNTENSVSNIVDPDTYMALPLRYYRSISRTAFPGFWIWSEKTKDVQKLTEEFKLQTAIIESNRYSLGSITGRGIEAIVNAQNNINPAEQIFVKNGPAISIISNIMEFAFFYTLISSIIDKRAQGKKVDDYYRDPEFIVGVKQGATAPISTESLIKKATFLCGEIFYGGFYRKAQRVARSPFDFDYRIDTDPIPNQVGLDISLPTYSRRNSNDTFAYVGSYGVIFTKTINLKALKIPRLEADLNNFTSKFFENNKLTPWTIYDQYQDEFSTQMFVGAVRPSYYNNPGKYRETSDNKTPDKVKEDFKAGLDLTQNELTAVVTNPDGYQNVNTSARFFAKALIISSNSNEYSILANRFKESTRWVTSNDIVRNSFAYKDETIQGSFKEILEAVIDQREFKAAQRQYTRDSRKIANITTLTRLLQNTAGAYGDAGFAVTKNSMSQLLDEASRYNFGEKISKNNPVYKIYFLQDNLREWLLMDDYYSYSGVESIAVTGAKNSPVATATLKLTNFTNKLSNVMADRLYRENPLLHDPSIQSDVSSILLKPGCHLKIYLGYGSVLTEEDCVFCGEITDMKGDQIKEITCMSYGTLLMEPLGVPSPVEIEVSTDDLSFQRNPYSILELLLKKVLVKNFLKTVTNISGRLGESSVLVGSSGFDVDTVDPLTKGIFNEIKDEITVPVLYKGLAKILGTTFLGGKIPVDAVGRFVGDAFNERYVSNNIIENVRIWHTPVNDTNYNVFNKREATEAFISDVNNSVLRPIIEDGSLPDVFSGLQEEISQIIERDTPGVTLQPDSANSTATQKLRAYAEALALTNPVTAPFAWGLMDHNAAGKELLKNGAIVAAEKTGNKIADVSETVVRGFEAFKKTIHEIGSNIKRPFTGSGIFNESHVAYNMTYWSYIQDVLLQMPNHVCVVRPFGERNTLVVTDRLRGYYRFNRKHLTSEAKTVNIIRLLEEFKGIDIDTLTIVMDSMLKPTEDSLALFILWYTFTARALSTYQANTAGRIFYQVPDKEQIQHVVACLNFVMSEAARVKRIQEVGKGLLTQAILSSDDNDYLTTYLNDQKTAENIRRTNQIEDEFAKNGTADLEEIRAQILKSGVNLPTDNVGARKFLMSSLFPSTKNILHSGLKNESFAAVMVAKVASLGLYIDVVDADVSKKERELSEDKYNQFAAAEAVRQGAAEVINWALAQAYQRSSSHKKVADLHYKETEVDIIDNSINLMKGFNAVNAFFLKEPKLVKDIPTTTDNSIFEEYDAPVSSNLKWLNKYQTFILNGPAKDSLNIVKAHGSMRSQILSNLVQDYYGGSITFVGDPRIKDWDQIYISDHMKDMFGLIEVNDYTHLYDKQNGFVTVVTPALPSFNDYATSSGPDIPWQWSLYGTILSGVKWAAIGTALFFGGRKLLRAFANRPAFMRIKLAVQSASKFVALPTAVTTKAANALKKVAGWAAWGEREFLGTNRVAQRINNFEQMQQIMTKSLDNISISKLANTKAIETQIGGVYNILNSEGKVASTEACKLREFTSSVKTKIEDSLGRVTTGTENFNEELKKTLLQSHPTGKIVEDRVIAKVQDAVKQRLKTVNDLNVAVVDSAEIVEKLGPTATPEKIFQALTDAMTLRVGKLGSIIKEDEIRAIVKTAINDEAATLRKEFDTIIANIPEGMEEAASLRASLKSDSDEIIKLLTDTAEDAGTQGASASSNSILKNIQTQLAGLERKPPKDELNKSLLNAYNETVASMGGEKALTSSLEVQRQIAMNVVDAYIVNIKSGKAFLKDFIGGNILEGGLAAVFGSFGGKGAIGAIGAYGVYSTFKEFIWDPTNDAYTALLTNFSGQNAVTISGLYSKGEPFVANLDGMEKRAINVISDGGPLLAYRARLGRNFEAFADTFGGGFRDAYSELVGTAQDLVRADNEIITHPDPQPTEVGAPGRILPGESDRPIEPFNTPK